jgi:hypothetical protein
MEEIWKDILGYEGIYQISSHGRLKSLARVDCKGQKRKERIISLANDVDGYKICTLSKDRVNKNVRIHRLVAQAFIENPHNLPQVNHIDSVRHNNFVENLEWCTSKQNTEHSVKLKRHSYCDRNGASVLTNKQVLEIYHSTLSTKRLSDMYGVGTLAITRIKNGYMWSMITGHKYVKKLGVGGTRGKWINDENERIVLSCGLSNKQIMEKYGIPQWASVSIKKKHKDKNEQTI